MNTDQLKGKIENAIGHVKESFGEATGDNKVANEGLIDQAKGAARETWGNAKDASSSTVANDHKAEATDHAGNVRQSISEHIDDAKAAINEHIDNYKETHDKV